MGAFLWLAVFILANGAINLLTRGKLAMTGIDFILPATVLVAHESGILWGMGAAACIIAAHYLTALNKLHYFPFALVAGMSAAVAAGLSNGGIAGATLLGILAYHISTFFMVLAVNGRVGLRYVIFTATNIAFTASVIGFFY